MEPHVDDELQHYIANLQLPETDPNELPRPNIRMRSPMLDGQVAIKSVVDAGAVLSFVDNVPPGRREDILNSVQLAQRAASGFFDRQADIERWYEKFVEIMERVGWVVEQFAFSKHHQDAGNLRIDKSALKIIAAIASQNALGVLTEAVTALESLADGGNAITIFDQFSFADMSGNFQLGVVEMGQGGALSMALGAFYYRATDRRKKVLFISWGANDIQFWTSAQRMTLNEEQYARGRKAVRQKLGDPLNYIASLSPIS